MKKRMAIILYIVAILSICTVPGGFASEVDYEAALAEKDAKIEALEAEIEALTTEIEQLKSPSPTSLEAAPLSKGSKGNEVTALQDRLIKLGYLSGKADGAYGNGTAAAVSEFQTRAGLVVTGTADTDTQAALFAEDAPKSLSAEYETLDYKANARDPEAYTGTKIKFSGVIVQVMEEDGYAVFRIATRNNYDDIVYAIYKTPENYKRFLEDDDVMVYATSAGIYTYTTVMGGELTIPSCMIESIVLK